jgi:hypothetical protein
MIQLTLATTMGGVAILLAVLFWFMPRLTRQDLYFAVTVPAGFRDEPQGKSILRRYRIELIRVSAVLFTAFVAGIVWLGVGFVPGGFFIQLVAWFIVFYRARQRALPYAVPPTMIRDFTPALRSFLVAGRLHWDRSFCWLHAPRTCGFRGQKRLRVLPATGVVTTSQTVWLLTVSSVPTS